MSRTISNEQELQIWLRVVFEERLALYREGGKSEAWLQGYQAGFENACKRVRK